MIKTEQEEIDLSIIKNFESVYSEPDADINLFET
jgi:hypothetical protein